MNYGVIFTNAIFAAVILALVAGVILGILALTPLVMGATFGWKAGLLAVGVLAGLAVLVLAWIGLQSILGN